MAPRAGSTISRIAAAFIMAGALGGCAGTLGGSSSEFSGQANRDFYGSILAAKETGAPVAVPREGAGRLAEDPATGQSVYIYSFACDEDRLAAELGTGSFTAKDREIMGAVCERYKAGEPVAKRLSQDTKDGDAVFITAQNCHARPVNEFVFNAGLTGTELALLSPVEEKALCARHEEGHAMAHLFGGAPRDIDAFYELWSESMADSYAILTAARDTRSLYTPSVWAQFRLAGAVPRPLRNDPNTISAVSPEYFNPRALETALQKAGELLGSGVISDMDDVALARLAWDISREQVMGKGAAMKFLNARNAVRDYHIDGGVYSGPESGLEKLAYYGPYEQDDPVIQSIERAIGFFRFMDRQAETKPQSAAPRHNAS